MSLPALTPVAQSVLHPAGQDALLISHMGWVMFVGGALILLLVMALLWTSLGRRQHAVSTKRWVVLGGVVFPLVVLIALLAWSSWRSAQLVARPVNPELVVSVNAKMWWWEVTYRDPAGGRQITLANELHIPVGKPVYLGLSSSDVIHSFWVPALGGKIDMVPGRVNGLTLQASQPGVYRGQCAEYCGLQHARMAFNVVAHTPEDFTAWLTQQAQPAASTDDVFLARGRQAFLDQACTSCHTIRGVGGDSKLGPDLTHIGSRLTIGAGILQNHRGTLAGWIADTQGIKPGARMPSFDRMDGETLRALAAYLEHLK